VAGFTADVLQVAISCVPSGLVVNPEETQICACAVPGTKREKAAEINKKSGTVLSSGRAITFPKLPKILRMDSDPFYSDDGVGGWADYRPGDEG
jgi:hypothetical protein